MSLITLADALAWCDEVETYFTITAANDELIFTSDQGGPVTLDITDGTYEGSDLATALQTAMNADNTLTGTGTIAFVVSYSSTTKKFTIDAGSGHTIAYTHLSSDGGLTFGFNEDAAAAQTITSDIPAGDMATRVGQIQDLVEGWAKRSHLMTNIEADDYVEYHSGGKESIFVKHVPIITLKRVTTWVRNGISLTNSNSDMAYATIKIDDDYLYLTIVGGTNAGASTIDFSDTDYDTLGEIVDGINALGTGWTAALADSDFSDFPYTELIQIQGQQIYDGDTYYLEIPDASKPGYTLDPDVGELRAYVCWPDGSRNVRVEYRGGYETVPAQIQTAIGMMVKAVYQRDQEDASGISSWSTAGIAKVYADLPPDVRRGLDSYARRSNAIW
jgi:hypothetical protein